ncbi:hypothetical protein AWZ03_014018 [Drosophila navojoa]|uniref:Uncharacterized protein n=1 Tax=Drosophila navojoa TaxID=7232 RepID=A0A484AT50_DRONA|nr:hypothetical protein AWZ03_014018 [Drosophila navojoa]
MVTATVTRGQRALLSCSIVPKTSGITTTTTTTGTGTGAGTTRMSGKQLAEDIQEQPHREHYTSRTKQTAKQESDSPKRQSRPTAHGSRPTARLELK